jgi:hypothetical protein
LYREIDEFVYFVSRRLHLGKGLDVLMLSGVLGREVVLADEEGKLGGQVWWKKLGGQQHFVLRRFPLPCRRRTL